MKVLLIYRNPAMGISIGKTYGQIQQELGKKCDVEDLYLPSKDYKISSLIDNIRIVNSKLYGNNYDIVHITGSEHYLIPFLKHKRVVVTVHDLGFYTQRKKSISLLLKNLLWIQTLRFAKCVICISNKTKMEVKKLAHINDKLLKIVYEPVGKEFVFSPKNIEYEHPVILQVGTRPHKNMELVAEAIVGSKYKLRIIGNLSQQQRSYLDSLQIDYSSVSNITDLELVEEYKKCDLVCFASKHEGFGMITLEAQATGRPVITSNIEPMMEVSGESAVHVNPYSVGEIRSGIEETMENYNKYVDLGCKNVKRFSMEKAAKEIYDLYEQLLTD